MLTKFYIAMENSRVVRWRTTRPILQQHRFRLTSPVLAIGALAAMLSLATVRPPPKCLTLASVVLRPEAVAANAIRNRRLTLLNGMFLVITWLSRVVHWACPFDRLAPQLPTNNAIGRLLEGLVHILPKHAPVPLNVLQTQLLLLQARHYSEPCTLPALGPLALPMALPMILNVMMGPALSLNGLNLLETVPVMPLTRRCRCLRTAVPLVSG